MQKIATFLAFSVMAIVASLVTFASIGIAGGIVTSEMHGSTSAEMKLIVVNAKDEAYQVLANQASGDKLEAAKEAAQSLYGVALEDDADTANFIVQNAK